MADETARGRIFELAEAVGRLQAQARVHETLLGHIVRWYFLQNDDPVNALRLIHEEVLKTIEERRSGHLYTDKAAEEMKIALDNFVGSVSKNIGAKDV